jgi:hypothetical protein
LRARTDSLGKNPTIPRPGGLAQEIGEDLEASLDQLREIAADLGEEATKETT